MPTNAPHPAVPSTPRADALRPGRSDATGDNARDAADLIDLGRASRTTHGGDGDLAELHTRLPS